MKLRKSVCLLSALQMMLCMPGNAELLPEPMPTPAAAQQAEVPVRVAEDEDPVMALMERIDQLVSGKLQEEGVSGEYTGLRPITAEESDAGDAIVLIGDLYTADMRQDLLSPEEYAGIRWLDRRAVVTLRKSSGGWFVESVSLDDELQMEDASSSYYEEELLSCTEDSGLWTIRYPALFGTLGRMQDNDGCTGYGAKAETGAAGASFFAGNRSNSGKMTAEELCLQLRQESPDAVITQNDVSGVIRAQTVSGDVCRASCYIVTESTIYHAEMEWDASLNQEFIRYSDYVMNSFSAAELGIG